MRFARGRLPAPGDRVVKKKTRKRRYGVTNTIINYSHVHSSALFGLGLLHVLAYKRLHLPKQ